MTRRLSWLISSVAVALLSMAITPVIVERSAASGTDDTITQQFQLSETSDAMDRLQMIWKSPAIHDTALIVKNSPGKSEDLIQNLRYQ